MSLNKAIAHNTIIYLAGKMIGLALSLLAIAFITRYLGVERFGFYITATSFLQFFGILVDFGLTLTTVQMISAPGRDISRVMNSIMSFRVLTAAAFLALSAGLIWFFPYNIFIKIGAIISVGSFFCTTLIQTLTGVFQQKLKMLQLTLAEIAGRIFFVALIFFAIWLNQGIYWVFGALTFGSIVNLGLALYFARQYIHWKWQVDSAIWRELIGRSWPIALSISFNLVYLRMDTIILSLTRTQAEVGLYGATYRVVDILTMLPSVFMGMVLPVAAQYFMENKKEELRNILQKSFDALMIFAVPIMVGAMLVARPLMVFVAGKEFALSGDILKVLIFASGAIFATSLFSYTVVALNKQKIMMWGYSATAISTLIGYLIFIPKFGYWGAAWMTVYSEVLILCWTAILVYRTIKFFPSLLTALKTVPAALIMAAVLYFIREIHVVALLAVAGVVYFLFLCLFRGIKKETVLELLRLK